MSKTKIVTREEHLCIQRILHVCMRAISKFSIKYPDLAKFSCSIILVGLWNIFFPVLSIISIVFSQNFFIAFLLGGGFAVASIIFTVGILEFILEDWNLLKTGLGFIVAIVIIYCIYLIIFYWEYIQ